MKINPIKTTCDSPEAFKTKNSGGAANTSFIIEEKKLPFIGAQVYRAQYFASVNLNFKGVQRATHNFELKDICGMDCPCCGDKMLTSSQSSKLVSEIKDSTGEELQKNLSKGFDYYKPTEMKVVQEIIEISKRFPEKNIKEIVQYKAPETKSLLEEKQISILEEIREISKHLDDTRRDFVDELIDKTICDIKNSTDDNHFRRNQFLLELDCLEHEKEDKVYEKITELAEKLPTTHNDASAFFVKFSRKTSEEIAQRLFSPSTVTTEHIIPKSKGGANSTENYIPLCGTCNSLRGNTPYNEWFKKHPEMPENLQKYLDKVATIIENREFRGAYAYENYIDEIIESIKLATDGVLVLKNPNLSTGKCNKLLKELQKLEKEINGRIKANEAKKGGIDFNSEYNIQKLEEYEVLKAQLRTIDKVDNDIFMSAFKDAEVSPEFVLEYSRDRILADLQNCIDLSDAVNYKHEQEAIQEKQNIYRSKMRLYLMKKLYNEET